jgi:hypothetical protein
MKYSSLYGYVFLVHDHNPPITKTQTPGNLHMMHYKIAHFILL